MVHPVLKDQSLSIQKLRALLNVKREEKARAEEAQDFYDGDHWRAARGYIGPLPDKDDEEGADILANIARGFTSRNVVKETTTRTVDGILGKEPDWKVSDTNVLTRTEKAIKRQRELAARSAAAVDRFNKFISGDQPETPPGTPPAPAPPKPPDDPQKPPVDPEKDPNAPPEGVEAETDPLMLEAETVLTTLWEDPSVLKALKDCFIGRLVTGRSCLRIYVPRRFLDDDGAFIAQDDLNEAIKALRFECVPADKARVLDHEGEMISVVSFEIQPDNSSGTPTKAIEVGYVDDDGKTFITVVSQDGGNSLSKLKTPATAEAVTSAAATATDEDAAKAIAPILAKGSASDGLDLGGNLTVAELEGEPFVSPQLIQNNKLLNLAMSMAGTALVEGGFPEMAVMNAAFQQQTIPGTEGTGQPLQTTQSKPHKRGPGVLQKFVGLKKTDGEGGEEFQMPGLHYKEPSPLITFKDGKALAYGNCLEEAHQLFIQISGDADASGESRLQARGDFLQRLLDYKPDVDRTGSWMLTTALHMAAQLAGSPGKFTGLIVKYDSKLFAGPLTSDERRVLLDEYKEGIKSKETTMILLGTDNVKEEKQLIAVEKEEDMTQNAMEFRLKAEQTKLDSAASGNQPPAPAAK